MSLENRIEKYNCSWLKGYLKVLIRTKDFKTYNRVKCVLYYFPDTLYGMTVDDLKTAFKYADESYICLHEKDSRPKMLDDFYKKKNGVEFSPYSFMESRYLTIEDICKYFKL